MYIYRCCTELSANLKISNFVLHGLGTGFLFHTTALLWWWESNFWQNFDHKRSFLGGGFCRNCAELGTGSYFGLIYPRIPGGGGWPRRSSERDIYIYIYIERERDRLMGNANKKDLKIPQNTGNIVYFVYKCTFGGPPGSYFGLPGPYFSATHCIYTHSDVHTYIYNIICNSSRLKNPNGWMQLLRADGM